VIASRALLVGLLATGALAACGDVAGDVIVRAGASTGAAAEERLPALAVRGLFRFRRRLWRARPGSRWGVHERQRLRRRGPLLRAQIRHVRGMPDEQQLH